MRSFSFFLAAALFPLVACGNVVTPADGSGGSTSQTSGTGKTSANASTGSSGGCGAFADAPSPGSITIRFRNDSSVPIYIPVDCSTPEYTIKPFGGGDPNVSYVYDPGCLQTCEDLQTQTPIACGPCAPMSWLLAPGATRDVAWDETGMNYGVEMPAQCYLNKMSQGSCSKVVAAPAGDYNLFATGYDSCGANCTCDANGNCNGYAMGAMATANITKMNLPNDTLVEIVFGVCAFPCPNP
jgi:hypothetical protein